jgi:peptidoglycan/LPS O-acetylase OafA/YrhL
MTVLARMGVPGEIAWLLLQSSFGFSMLAAYFRARRLGREWWARLNLWILAYWLAFLVAMSFGVYLEGPYGGIWFWCLLGFGIALLEAQRSDVRSRHVASREPYEAAARS